MADKFQLKALITGVDKLSPTLAGIRRNVAGFRKQLQSSGLGEIGFSDLVTGGALAAPFVLGAQAAIGFESAMADVRKVVDFDTPEQFRQMGAEILDLSERLPMAAEGIAAIVAAGGQSGIARDELKGFAEDAVKMAVAFDTTADAAGEQMAKWRSAFRLTQGEVVGLADQINHLSNTGAATPAQISAIVTAIGPLGEVAGLAAGQIAAMGSTLTGMGVQQDVAATGIKNMMLALTAGSQATKAQSELFAALRLDAKAVAEGMQDDAEGTISKVLEAISRVDKSKQAGVMSGLFGKESIGAIAPLLTNLDQLKASFAEVSDAGRYGGSMLKEYESRSKTTANAMQLMRNRVTGLGIAVGSVLLPPLNDFLGMAGPLVSGVADLAAANPWLIKGLLGAGAAFVVLRGAVMASTVAMGLLSAVTSASPIGLIVRAIALAGGFLIANWSTVGPWFAGLWESLSEGAAVAWEWIKAVFAWTPLGVIAANWEPLVGFFSAVFGVVQAVAGHAWEWIKALFAWTPLGMIAANWEPLVGFFSALWDVVKALAGHAWEWIKAAFAWTPLGMIAANWEPLVGYFRDLWERIKPYIQPLTDAAAWVGEKAGGVADWVGEKSSGLASGLASGVDMSAPLTAGAGSLRGLAGRLSPAADPGALVRQSQAAQAGQSAKLDGSLLVRFDNAPPGLRVEQAKTSQPGVTVSPSVGYRSLSGGGA